MTKVYCSFLIFNQLLPPKVKIQIAIRSQVINKPNPKCFIKTLLLKTHIIPETIIMGPTKGAILFKNL